MPRMHGWDKCLLGRRKPQLSRSLKPAVKPLEDRTLPAVAFPGAEGFGAATPGGRGGDVYHVTNLNDSGPGSLRSGIQTASGPRTIVFDVSGTITLQSRLSINKPFLTLAGQTAPGDGITLRGYGASVRDTNDVIVRFLRFRPGDISCPGVQDDSFNVYNSTAVIVDHVSASWSIDETLSVTDSGNVTVQWSLITESLNQSCHAEGAHGFGSLLRYGSGGLTFHHNFYAHHTSRNPRLGDNLQLDFVNNVIYDWGSQSGYSGSASEGQPQMNHMGNYAVAGPSTASSRITSVFQGGSSNTQIYQSGNRIDSNRNGVRDGTDTGWGMFTGSYTQVANRFDFPPVQTDSAPTAYDRVLADAGASRMRDAVDARVLNNVRNETGSIIDSQNSVGGWPALQSAPAPADADEDGMPDFWEQALRLDPASSGDRNGDPDGDGYTNLEDYLNWLAAGSAPLGVQALRPTTTGLAIQFNRPLDAGALNLYDTGGGGLGPADVTLTGNMAGAVLGSLAVNPAAGVLTFLRTGSVLQAGTYTVTLRSAADGFKDTTGGLLDGNGDGTPGDNYTATFTVVPSSAVVVSVPDFMRGPGQPANVPADVSPANGLPLRLSDGAGVRDVRLTLGYDAALLAITGATRGPSTPLDAIVTLDTSTPGQAVLTYSSTTALAAGAIDFAILTASVPDTAPYASKQVLDIANLQIDNGTCPALDDDGLHVVGYFGDTTGSAGYSSIDAQRALRVAVGLDGGFAAYQLVDPVVIADITGNGLLSSTDAARLLQEVVGLDRPEIPPLPPDSPTIVPGGPDPLLHFPTTFRGRPGDTIMVPLLLEPSDGLESADLAISYDARRLEVVGVQRGSLTDDFDLFVVNPGMSDGTLRVGLSRSDGPISGRSSASVIEISFRIRPDAPAGKAVINLRRDVDGMQTALNEGGLDLIPDPSDEEGDVLDGLVTVLGKSSQTLPVSWNGHGRQEKPTSRISPTDAVFAMLDRRQRRNAISSEA